MEDDGLAAPTGGGAPARDHGGHSVIVSGGVWQTGRHHRAEEKENQMLTNLNIFFFILSFSDMCAL